MYLPRRKIVLVSNFEDTFTDKSLRTAYCALRAYKTLHEEKRIIGSGFFKQRLDMERFWYDKIAEAPFVKAFIQFSHIVSDVRDYVPLYMTIDFGALLIERYLNDTKNPAYIEFLSRKLREVKQKYPKANLLGGNYFMYEEMIFNSPQWLQLAKPWMQTVQQLRMLRDVFVVDAAHGQRNAYEMYFLTTETPNSTHRAFAFAKTLVTKSLLKPDEVGEAKASLPKNVMHMLFIKEHLMHCSDFNCSGDAPNELLKRLLQIAALENVTPRQVWLLSESFIDCKGILRSAGFTNQYFLTSETTNALLKEALSKGMTPINRDSIAERIDYESKCNNF